MANWVTISGLATAGGTLVLAGATFASVRSATRAARVAENSMLAGLRPLLMPSRLTDAPQKVGFVDKWFSAPGGGGVAEATDEVVYLRARYAIRPHPSSRPSVTRSRHASVWSSTCSTAITKAGSASSRASR